MVGRDRPQVTVTLCMMGNLGSGHTLMMYNTYCFSTAARSAHTVFVPAIISLYSIN